MDDSSTDDDPLPLGAAAVYAAMLGATVGGQLLGIGLDALLGVHAVAVPAALSVVLEAIAGARLGARAEGHPLGAARSGVLSATYTLGLLLVTVPLVAWYALSGKLSAPGEAFSWTSLRAVLVLGAFAVSVPVRWGLMMLFAPRSR